MIVTVREREEISSFIEVYSSVVKSVPHAVSFSEVWCVFNCLGCIITDIKIIGIGERISIATATSLVCELAFATLTVININVFMYIFYFVLVMTTVGVL